MHQYPAVRNKEERLVRVEKPFRAEIISSVRGEKKEKR